MLVLNSSAGLKNKNEEDKEEQKQKYLLGKIIAENKSLGCLPLRELGTGRNRLSRHWCCRPANTMHKAIDGKKL